MSGLCCARCQRRAAFIVEGGTPGTNRRRAESVCAGCLSRSKKWAGAMGAVSVTPIDQPALFDLTTEVTR